MAYKWILPSAALILAILDVAIRVWYLGASTGWTEVAHDPGKHVFHLIILPFVLLLLIDTQSHRIVCGITGWPRVISNVTLALLLIIATWFTAMETRDSFFTRLTTPEDIADQSLREDLLLYRSGVWKNAEYESNNNVSADKSSAMNAHAYAAKLIPGEDVSFTTLWKHMSWRRVTATLCALMANLTCAYIFWLICMVPVAGSEMTEARRQFFLVTIGALTLWLPLKMYSEWHHNFHQILERDDQAMTVGALLSLVALFLVYAFRSRSMLFTLTSGAVAAASLILYFLAGQLPAQFGFVASVFSEAKPFVLATCYIILFTSAIFYATFLIACTRRTFGESKQD